MAIKLRLIFRSGVVDYNGKLAEYLYKTDIVTLADNSPAYTFPISAEQYMYKDQPGWLPELIGGEWIIEKD
jgi:hypothetical protein